MYTREVKKLGDRYVPNFIGVFPLDRLPRKFKLKTSVNFILNTHTHNLPGEHWLAVSFQKSKMTLYAFDPFGHKYPQILKSYLTKVKQLARLPANVVYNKIQYQELHEKSCGLYCIAWLIYINKLGVL